VIGHHEWPAPDTFGEDPFDEADYEEVDDDRPQQL
jgi:hypothetical protein